MAALRLSSRTVKLSHSPPCLHAVRRHVSSSATPNAPPVLRRVVYASLLTVSAGLFAAYYFDSRSAVHRYVLTPVLRHLLDPETGHKVAVKVLASGLGPYDTQIDNGRLRSELWGEQLSNPVGLAAGFDKHGEAIDGLFDLGFSWVEIGSITPKPQPGNPRPRMFRLPADDAVINRYGFPSEGHAAVLARLRARISPFATADESVHASLRSGALLAVNLGKNKSSPVDSIDDFVAGVRAFGPYADVLVVNVSSPNTPGLRGLQNHTLLEELLDGVTRARDSLTMSPSEPTLEPAIETAQRRPKIVLKIAPDLDEAEVAGVAAAVKSCPVDGVIVSNTTVKRPASLSDPNKTAVGGLSGPPLKPYALTTLRALRAALPASVPLIGCGGISSGGDALEYAKAGAAAVQLYTSFGYDGVGAARRIKDELAAALEAEGTTWGEVVHRAVQELSLKENSEGQGKEEPEAFTVAQLRLEAEELMKLVDRLGEQVDGESAAEEAAAAVVPTVS
ncbi:dihydroorotate dehydrogenase [Wolfiporia cocos MD-104 SS10]|uniref:Dihydroorotate dehydrogenase (quinone), mitochondrial n=1 Tax=Wolfiporia cocos (strain MD-104) TaxID=742152 RepID=A0A2H3K1T4_WOLCO|nr:dihydroorotate dehydrogenase [Wolfiporia cocos MD-104 SS10]